MTAQSPHPSAESLAAYAAGDLASGDVAGVVAHIAGCPDCAQDLAAVERVTQALAALPPVTMPVAVVAAVDAAVRAESARTASAARRGGRLMPFAVAAATVGLAAAIGYGTLGGQSSDAPEATSLADAGSAQGGSAGPVLLQTGTDYTAAGLDGQLRGVLTSTSAAEGYDAADQVTTQGGGSAAAPEADMSPSGPMLRATAPLAADDPGLRSCVAELAGDPAAQPVLVDVASFAGEPAWVVVLPFRDTKVDVFVVRPSCREGDAALLYFERVTTG